MPLEVQMETERRNGVLGLYCSVKSLEKYWQTRDPDAWNYTQTFQIGHWCESLEVSKDLVFGVDPYDEYTNQKDLFKKTEQKNTDILWNQVASRHSDRILAVQLVSGNLKDVLKDPCFEYATFDPETFWKSNEIPKVYPYMSLGKTLPYMSVSPNRIRDRLDFQSPNDDFLQRPALSMVLRRRPSRVPQVWSLHVTRKSDQAEPFYETPENGYMRAHEFFQNNRHEYWSNFQTDVSLLLRNTIERDPVEISSPLIQMVNGFYITTPSEKVPKESCEKKTLQKKAPKSELSLKQRLSQELWTF